MQPGSNVATRARQQESNAIIHDAPILIDIRNALSISELAPWGSDVELFADVYFAWKKQMDVCMHVCLKDTNRCVHTISIAIWSRDAYMHIIILAPALSFALAEAWIL